MIWIYRLVLYFADVLIPLVSFFSKKVRVFYNGRKDVFERVKSFRKEHQGALAWIHVASLGEFEQVKPLIRMWKQERPEEHIFVSFFSPSGMEPVARRKDQDLDGLAYLPLDRSSYAKKFVDNLQPQVVFFVKYDLWYHYLKEVSSRGIPLYLISASFRHDQVYFRRNGFWRAPLFFFTHIFTQNEQSGELLDQIGYSQYTQAGDTRFDQVAAHAGSPQAFPEIAAWLGSDRAVVLGSVWQEDMDLLIPLMEANPSYKYIIAPHSMDLEPMGRWKATLTLTSAFYTQWKGEAVQVLWIDTIGLLASLYQYAYLAYVGGAFGSGLHNILEPVGFGVPVVFGTCRVSGKFPEAAECVQQGCGIQVQDFRTLETAFSKFSEEAGNKQAREAARKWLVANLGATKKIYSQTHP